MVAFKASHCVCASVLSAQSGEVTLPAHTQSFSNPDPCPGPPYRAYPSPGSEHLHRKLQAGCPTLPKLTAPVTVCPQECKVLQYNPVRAVTSTTPTRRRDERCRMRNLAAMAGPRLHFTLGADVAAAMLAFAEAYCTDGCATTITAVVASWPGKKPLALRHLAAPLRVRLAHYHPCDESKSHDLVIAADSPGRSSVLSTSCLIATRKPAGRSRLQT